MRRLGSLLRTRRRESSRQSFVTLHGVSRRRWHNGVECERCPGASDSERLFRDIENGTRKSHGTRRSGRASLLPPSLLSCIETVQKVLEDAIVVSFRRRRMSRCPLDKLGESPSLFFPLHSIFIFAPNRGFDTKLLPGWKRGVKPSWFGNPSVEGKMGKEAEKEKELLRRKKRYLRGKRKKKGTGDEFTRRKAVWKNLPVAFRSLGLLVTEPLSRRLTRIFMSFRSSTRSARVRTGG